MKLPFKISKWVFVILHITFWLLLFSLPFLLQMYAEKNAANAKIHKPGISFYILKCLFWTAFFYINAYFLFPKWYYTKQYKKYVLSLISILAFGLVLELFYSLITH